MVITCRGLKDETVEIIFNDYCIEVPSIDFYF